MGINGSKFNHKVRKVTPLENKDAFDSPAQIPGYNGSDSLSSYGRVEQSNLIWERQLPPLRETLYGRGLIVPSPLSFDIPLENGNTTSIIKRHPPRRLQKLEPVVLPTIISAERIISNQGQAIGKRIVEHTCTREVGPYQLELTRRTELFSLPATYFNAESPKTLVS
eukprot:XP_012824236.2 PREDICTED: uncharacterized protein C14orf105 homolog [Xenopus tropicalis]